MNSNVKKIKSLWLCALLLAFGSAQAATLSFQGRTYDISIVTLGPTVPNVTTNDLIFVQVPNGTKFLAIPSDAVARGDFDIVNQRFYMLTRNTGQIDAYSNINGTLIRLDGTLFGPITQTPDFSSQPLETISRPLSIPSTDSPVDVCIVNNELFGYRTDGPLVNQQKVYTITRASTSVEVEKFPVALVNGDPANSNRSVFLAHDNDTGNYLLSQIALDPDPVKNPDLRDRVTAYKRDGTLTSELILESTTLFPTYSGNAVGITVDRSTGDIYVLDSFSSQIFVFKPQRPAITSLTPPSGGTAGGTSVSISGVNLPADVAVFFGDSPATINEAGTKLIKVTTPPHGLGTVDVLVTGTGIPAGAPLRLVSAFTYVNTRPSVVLSASPNQGPKPLTVLFDMTGTGDTDGSLASLKLDFGDGQVQQLATDGSQSILTHTYVDDGTFIARLTATDNLGDIGMTNAVIVAGTGGDDLRLDLFLKSLSFKIKAANDTVTVKGNISLPEASDLANASIVLGFIHPVKGALVEPVGASNEKPFVPVIRMTELGDKIDGGEFFIKLGEPDTRFKVKSPVMKFNIKPLKNRFLPANTQNFNLTVKKQDLAEAVKGAVVNLFLDEGGEELSDDEQKEKRVGKVLVLFQVRLASLRVLTFAKLAVVNINSKSTKTTTSIKLVRQ